MFRRNKKPRPMTMTRSLNPANQPRAANSTPNSTPNRDKGQRSIFAALRAAEGAENDRTFELSFSSEEPVERFFGSEILDHSDGCVDLTRLLEIGVLLFNHDTDQVIGKVTRAWVEDGKGHATVEFDEDPESERICAKVRSGTLKGVSVGYQVTDWEDVSAQKKSQDGRFTGPCSIAKRWMPYEISIVSVPADMTVGVGRKLTPDAAAQRSGTGKLKYYESLITQNKNLLGGTT